MIKGVQGGKVERILPSGAVHQSGGPGCPPCRKYGWKACRHNFGVHGTPYVLLLAGGAWGRTCRGEACLASTSAPAVYCRRGRLLSNILID